MTNTLAFWVGGFLVAAILLDQVFNGGDALLFMAKKLVGLAHIMAFWR